MPDKNTESIGELTGNGYQRIQIPCNTTNFTIANRTATNQVEFIGEAATADWPTIKSFALYKTLNGGADDLLWYNAFEPGKQAVIFKNDKVVVPIGALTVSE